MQRPNPPPRRLSSLANLPPLPPNPLTTTPPQTISQPPKHEPPPLPSPRRETNPAPSPRESPREYSPRNESPNPSPTPSPREGAPPVPRRSPKPADPSPSLPPSKEPPLLKVESAPSVTSKTDSKRAQAIKPTKSKKRKSTSAIKDTELRLSSSDKLYHGQKRENASKSIELPVRKGVNFKLDEAKEEKKSQLSMTADKAAILSQLQKSLNKETYSKQLLIKQTLDRNSGEGGKKRNSLEHALLEILTAERAYVKNVSFLQNHYILPLSSEAWEGKDEVKYNLDQLNVPSILLVNEQLLQQLEKLFDGNDMKGDIAEIGNVFLQLSPFFKSYSFYCSNYESVMKNLEKCYQNFPMFVEYCKQRGEEGEARGLDLASFLIMPVQRLCRYPLLLSAVKSELHKNNMDVVPSIDKAIETMSEITKVVNEKKREAENRDRVIAIQNNLKNAEGVVLIASNRTFLKEGFTNLSINNDGESKSRYLFLFNDTLVIAKPKKKLSSITHSLFTSRTQADILNSHDVQLKELIQLGLCSLRMCNESSTLLELIIDQEPKVTYQFIFDDDEKKKWIDSFLCTIIFHRLDGNRMLLPEQDDDEEEPAPLSKSEKKKKESGRLSRVSSSSDTASTNHNNNTAHKGISTGNNKPFTPPVPYRQSTLNRSSMINSKLTLLQKSVSDLEAFIAVEEEYMAKLNSDIASMEPERNELFKQIELLNQKYDLTEVLTSLGFFDSDLSG